MIKQNEGGVYLDLNSIPEKAEISIKTIKSIQPEESKEYKENKFSYEEVENNDASASLYYTQNSNKLLINVYGPRECKYREKSKTEEAIVEVYSKFNYEINKESKKRIFFIEILLKLFLAQKRINGTIQNFCESLIFLDSYPRCQINICLNVLLIMDEAHVKNFN
jgi:ribonuclease PH